MADLIDKDELRRRTEAIRTNHEDWWRDEHAIAELKALWGEAINDSGVFIDQEDETLFDRDGCKAEVSIGGAHDLYAFGCRFSYPTGGFGHAPSISGELFSSREEARNAAIKHISKHIPELHRHEGAHQHRISCVRSVLNELLTQPSLFP